MITFSKIEDFFIFLRSSVIKTLENLKIFATGGGALKYQ